MVPFLFTFSLPSLLRRLVNQWLPLAGSQPCLFPSRSSDLPLRSCARQSTSGTSRTSGKKRVTGTSERTAMLRALVLNEGHVLRGFMPGPHVEVMLQLSETHCALLIDSEIRLSSAAPSSRHQDEYYSAQPDLTWCQQAHSRLQIVRYPHS